METLMIKTDDELDQKIALLQTALDKL